jgi:hypothetical protein
VLSVFDLIAVLLVLAATFGWFNLVVILGLRLLSRMVRCRPRSR